MTQATITKFDTKTQEHMDFQVEKNADNTYNEIVKVITESSEAPISMDGVESKLDSLKAVLGAVDDVAVLTDQNGTIQQFLRGLISILVSGSGIVNQYPDLKLGAKSIALTMSSGTGSVPIPDTVTVIGVKPTSTTMRFGLEATEADGAKTGVAIASDLKNGVPCDSGSYTWFNIGKGTSRTLYVSGGASDVTEVVMM